MSTGMRFEHTVCNGCSCKCDDLTVETLGRRITRIAPDCSLANRFFLGVDAGNTPAAAIAGKPVSYAEALARAAELVSHARNPLLFGLSALGSEGCRAAIALADRLGARIDLTPSRLFAQSVIAFQNSGQSACSLGEWRDRADLTVFWRCDPTRTLPRFRERYAGLNQENKRFLVVDSQRTRLAEGDDSFFELPRGGDFEFLWRLRAAVKAHRAGKAAPSHDDRFNRFVAALTGASYGVFLFGEELAADAVGHAAIDALTRLTRELNSVGRFHLRAIGEVDMNGADGILCRQTGYPMSVGFAHGYPRYEPDDYSASASIVRRETDCVLALGGDALARLSPPDAAAIERLPTIVIGPPAATKVVPAVMIATATPGLHCGGIATRLDDVPLPLRAVEETSLPKAEDVLTALAALMN